ncbi:hypothetical protein MBUL_01309 [Methylobacterium bullatum]|uniref:Uncharacterized protein n=1 Tax=Methylobacterium bullatum TaxID=570505 RepID=A0A679IS40_9HYPH|nr:hypothetical protein MBUL_01309 [Methylobacterium bullatum]
MKAGGAVSSPVPVLSAGEMIVLWRTTGGVLGGFTQISIMERVDLRCEVRKKSAYSSQARGPVFLMRYLLASNENFGPAIIRLV